MGLFTPLYLVQAMKLILALCVMAAGLAGSEAWADKIPEGTIGIWPPVIRESTATAKPVTVEWGPCFEIHTKVRRGPDLDEVKYIDYWVISSTDNCTRQIGYRSDGVCVHRDPRKK